MSSFWFGRATWRHVTTGLQLALLFIYLLTVWITASLPQIVFDTPRGPFYLWCPFLRCKCRGNTRQYFDRACRNIKQLAAIRSWWTFVTTCDITERSPDALDAASSITEHCVECCLKFFKDSRPPRPRVWLKGRVWGFSLHPKVRVECLNVNRSQESLLFARCRLDRLVSFQPGPENPVECIPPARPRVQQSPLI